MSWSDNNPGGGYGGSMGNPGGGVGGTASGGSSGSRGGGSSYAFRRTQKGMGNWNTGGVLAGFGSLGAGIRSANPPSANRVGIARPAGNPIAPPTMPPAMVAPTMPPASYPQPGTVTDVFGPRVPMDPGIVAHMLGTIGDAPQSPYGTMPGYNGVKDPSRHPGMGGPRNSGSGRVGGGMGGGGGW